jgi:hypothetical protein
VDWEVLRFPELLRAPPERLLEPPLLLPWVVRRLSAI